MSRRWFTADFHLGMDDCLRYDKRGIDCGGQFSSVEEMNNVLVQQCIDNASADDMIIHVGDLATFKCDRGSKGLQIKPIEIVKTIPATFINIRGNHDINNKVKSVCDSMRTHLGVRFPQVSISHYPSYDKRSNGHWQNGDIHVCGHVHRKWKHCLDIDNKVLNVNVGVDVWNYQLVSEEQLIKYIDTLLKLPFEKINKLKTLNGKQYHV